MVSALSIGRSRVDPIVADLSQQRGDRTQVVAHRVRATASGTTAVGARCFGRGTGSILSIEVAALQLLFLRHLPPQREGMEDDVVAGKHRHLTRVLIEVDPVGTTNSRQHGIDRSRFRGVRRQSRRWIEAEGDRLAEAGEHQPIRPGGGHHHQPEAAPGQLHELSHSSVRIVVQKRFDGGVDPAAQQLWAVAAQSNVIREPPLDQVREPLYSGIAGIQGGPGLLRQHRPEARIEGDRPACQLHRSGRGAVVGEHMLGRQPHRRIPIALGDQQIHQAGNLGRVPHSRMVLVQHPLQPAAHCGELQFGRCQLEALEVAVVGDAVLNVAPGADPAPRLSAPEKAPLGGTPAMPVGLDHLRGSAGAEAVVARGKQAGGQGTVASPGGLAAAAAETGLQGGSELPPLCVDQLVAHEAWIPVAIPNQHQGSSRLGAADFGLQAHGAQALDGPRGQELARWGWGRATDETEVSAVEPAGAATEHRAPIGSRGQQHHPVDHNRTGQQDRGQASGDQRHQHQNGQGIEQWAAGRLETYPPTDGGSHLKPWHGEGCFISQTDRGQRQ